MTTAALTQPARADALFEADTLKVLIGGDWQITEHHPDWADAVQRRKPRKVVLNGRDLTGWDSSLALHTHASRT